MSADEHPSTRARLRWHPRGFNNAAIFGATYYGVTHLPVPVSYGIGRVGSWLAWKLQRSGTAALVENLRAVLPEASDRELRQLARLTYRSYTVDTIDFMRSLEMSDAEFARKVERIDTSSIDRVIDAGQGVISVTAHYGNWELGAVLLRRFYDYPVSVVVMREISPTVSALRRQFRRTLNIETLEVRQSMDTALKIRGLLNGRHVLGMLLDRYVGRDRVPVTFFGRVAYFLRTPALMSYLTGCPMVPAFVYRLPDGRHSGVCLEAIYVARDGDRDANVQRATQAFANLLEEQIRRRPQYWYQFYPFWATQEQLNEGPDLQTAAHRQSASGREAISTRR
jgi:KDO2-lipid IV(A) lauroyltransferase